MPRPKNLRETITMVIQHKKRVATNQRIICPNCDKEYDQPINPKTTEESEQLISGICSNILWNKFLGLD